MKVEGIREQVSGVRLELSLQESIDLMTICGRLSGPTLGTARETTDEIYSALDNLGLEIDDSRLVGTRRREYEKPYPLGLNVSGASES